MLACRTVTCLADMSRHLQYQLYIAVSVCVHDSDLMSPAKDKTSRLKSTTLLLRQCRAH